MTYYNRTNTCDLCRINFDIVSGHPHREYNKEGNWTGRWICNKCYQKAYDKERRISNRRTGNLNPNCSSAKGDNFEELTRRWRSIISTIPIKNLNRELDCYNTPIDHTRDPELGILRQKDVY